MPAYHAGALNHSANNPHDPRLRTGEIDVVRPAVHVKDTDS